MLQGAQSMHSLNALVGLACGWSCGAFTAVRRVLAILCGAEFHLIQTPLNFTIHVGAQVHVCVHIHICM